MTIAAVASGQFGWQTSSGSLTTHAIGNFILAEGGDQGGKTSLATALASTNVSWTPLGTSFAGINSSTTCQVFLGRVTAISTVTLTTTFSGTPTLPYTVGREFSTTAGFTSITLDKQGHIDSTATANWASLTPANNNSLYWGWASCNSSAAAGTTSGYVWNISSDGHGNGEAYNPNCPAGTATFPVWADGQQLTGIMVVMYEAAAGVAILPQQAKKRMPAYFARLTTPQRTGVYSR
jgi:hypothetical protein